MGKLFRAVIKCEKRERRAGGGRSTGRPLMGDNNGRSEGGNRKNEEQQAAKGSGVSIEMVKASGETANIWMWEVLNEVWKSERIPEEWTRSEMYQFIKTMVTFWTASNMGR